MFGENGLTVHSMRQLISTFGSSASTFSPLFSPIAAPVVHRAALVECRAVGQLYWTAFPHFDDVPGLNANSNIFIYMHALLACRDTHPSLSLSLYIYIYIYIYIHTQACMT